MDSARALSIVLTEPDTVTVNARDRQSGSRVCIGSTPWQGLAGKLHTLCELYSALKI
ncbi:hypothetical protein [Entomohabitans teleogrylli]|uniref:hypothetical protein n=1 Tax=Entomohabitans teleogrylli TaxID=1384589 RepID=UPI000A8A6818|nr:hypothetical protein [Entomohabitans teleogrylli]